MRTESASEEREAKPQERCSSWRVAGGGGARRALWTGASNMLNPCGFVRKSDRPCHSETAHSAKRWKSESLSGFLPRRSAIIPITAGWAQVTWLCRCG